MASIGIVGMGPAGLMCGYQLAQAGHEVHFYDQKKAAGRKFLVAGHGGFNLSNDKEIDAFVARYNHPFVEEAVRAFTNEQLVAWLHSIGVPTYIGSSGKVFPKQGIKPIQVLQAWLTALEDLGARFHYEHEWVDFSGNTLLFRHNNREVQSVHDVLVFALGGASWSKTGSTGSWLKTFTEHGISCVPFESSNAGMQLKEWDASRAESVWKHVQVKLGDGVEFGEVLLTEYGMEGAPIYALNTAFRQGKSTLSIDLKPMWNHAIFESKLKAIKDNRTRQLRALKIPGTAIDILKMRLSKVDYMDDSIVVHTLKDLQFDVVGLRPLEEAISSVGGVSMNAVESCGRLIGFTNIWVVGEMLDWDAPTGGYLLQACFAQGVSAAKSINSDLVG